MEAELTKSEQSELARLCKVVDEGLSSFLAVGTALKQISAGNLYRATHATFEEFVKQRWNIGKSHAHRMMDAAEIHEELSPIGGSFPIVNEIKTERQLRELKRLGGEGVSEAMEKITEVCKETGKKPTAKVIEAVVREMLGKPEPEPVKPEPSREDSLEREQRHIDLARKHLSGLRLALSNLGAGKRFDEYWANVEEWING